MGAGQNCVGSKGEPVAGEIDARTRLVGVMGWPVEHSLSPAMHNAVLHELGLNWRYVPLPVRPGAVGEAVRGAAALGLRGFNVTVPHKRAVMALLDEIAPEAAIVGAVNTVVIDRDDRGWPWLTGHNTDVRGFLDSLRAGGFEPGEGEAAVVVGAGGSARAVVYGLMRAGIGEVTILNRTPARAEKLVSDLCGIVPQAGGRLRSAALTDQRLVAAARGADLLVNATTVGMWPETGGSIWPEEVPLPACLTVYDLVYNPLETRLLSQARAAGARAIDGLGMLARQGALALELWISAPLNVAWATGVMRAVCQRSL